MTTDSSERYTLLNRLAEDFADRYRRGERPSLQEYIDRHPDLADDIREFFPAMVEMEQVKDEQRQGRDEQAVPASPALQQLGDFRIIREVGKGGMGIVYEAEQVSLGRHVALKVLPKGLLLDAKAKRRFEREAKSAAKLHHTNIVPVFGVGEQEGMPYYVMQFIQGLGLDEVLEELKRQQAGDPSGTGSSLAGGELRVLRKDVSAIHVAHSLLTGEFVPPAAEEDSDPARPGEDRKPAPDAAAAALTLDHDPAAPPKSPAPSTPVAGRLSDQFSLTGSSVVLPGSGSSKATRDRPSTYWQSVARIGVQVAEALEYAHKQGVLHRDIKPSNLLLDTQGTVWVTDFGLAKADDQQNLTHTGDVLGTLRYMPPEAFDGRSDARGDVYALGLTLYELLAFRPAFSENDRNRLIKLVTTQEPARLDRLNSDVPRDLVTIVHKAIDRDVAHRYPTAGELEADLKRFLEDEPIHARRHTQIERYLRWARRNPGIAVLGGVLTAVLVVATVASLLAAGYFNRLRLREAQAAQSERDARDREAEERAAAEQASKAANESRAQAVAALQNAEENYAKARAAVNDYLTAISDDPRLNESGLSPLRAQLLQSALGFYQEFLKERADDPALRRELAAVYFKVGQIYSDLGDSQPANQSFAHSRQLYEALAQGAPDDPAVQDGLARALFRQGEIDRAIVLWEKLIRPDDPRYHADLGRAYSSAAMRSTKDAAKELEFLRKALATRERLVALRPDDLEARLGLASSLNNIAVALGTRPAWAYLLETGREAEKLSLYRRAAEQMEVAYRLRPNDPLAVRGVVVLVRNVAQAAKVLAHADEAVAAYRRVIEVLDRRARDNPDLPGTLASLPSPPGSGAGGEGAGSQTVAAEMVTAHQTLVAYLRELGRLDEAALVARAGRDRAAEVTTDADSFFHALARFHLEARAVAEARAKRAPDAAADVEAASAAAVAAFRNNVLTGWRDSKWLLTDLLPAPLRKRADYRELIARVDALTRAEQVAKNAQSTPAERVTARQECLKALEALAGPLPTARFARRSVAQARLDLAQALLDAGRVDDARSMFAEALAVRERLVEEAPSSEQLRADLAQSQSAIGDLFAAAGKLGDAVRIWEKALATLEDGLKKNPNSIPFQTALSERLLHIAYESGRVGLWDLATKHYRRAFEFRNQLPTEFGWWYQFGLLLMAANDAKELEALAARAVVPLAVEKNDWNFFHLSRIFLLSPELASRHTGAIRQVVEKLKVDNPDWTNFCRGLAYVRLGQAAKGVPLLEQVTEPMERLPALALALHQLGRSEAARDALRQADEVAEQLLHESLLADGVKAPGRFWDERLFCGILRREAHQIIHGQPMPESPYDKLFRGRLHRALGDAEKAEVEFAAAVAMRPQDADVRLTRSRIDAMLDHKPKDEVGRMKDEKRSDLPATSSSSVILPPSSLGLAEAARRQRKDRADRLSTEFALALIGASAGPKAKAESELRSILSAREKLAAEEPTNPDYRSDVFASHIQLGRLLADSGRLDEADKELSETIATGQKLVAIVVARSETTPTPGSEFRARLDLAAAYRALGGVAWKSNRHADSIRAQRSGIEQLDAARKVDPENAGLRKLLADAEYQLGDCYGRLLLLPEAAAVMRVDNWPGTVNLWLQVRAGQLRLLAGDPNSIRKVADRALTSHGTDTGAPDGPHDKAWTLAAVALAHALAPAPNDDSERFLEWARQAAAHAPLTAMPNGVAGAWEFRTGRYEDAIRRLDTPTLRDTAWANAILAMVYHKLNQPDRALEWLQKASAHLANRFRSPITTGGATGDVIWDYLVDDLSFYTQAHQLVTGKPPASDPLQRLYRALGYFALGEGEKAEAEFTAAGEARPDDPAVWLARGRAYAIVGQPSRAAADFARAEALATQALVHPEGVHSSGAPSPLAGISPHAFLGMIQLERGNARAAVATINQAVAGARARPAEEHLVLALAEHRLGNKDQARLACRQALATMRPLRPTANVKQKPLSENDLLLELVRAALWEFGLDDPDAELLLAAAAGEPPAALTEAIQKYKGTGLLGKESRPLPEQAAAYLARGEWYGRRGLCRKAADDLAAAYRLQSDALTGMRVGILLAWIGDADRYRHHCQELLKRFAGTKDNYEADRTLKTCCLLGPGLVGDPAVLDRLADVAVSGDPGQPWYEWFLLAKGLYEYRAGRYDAAVMTCRTNRARIKTVGGSEAMSVAVFAALAMALHRTGDADGARRSLADAKPLVDKKLLILYGGDLGEGWANALAAQLLYREAESLLKGDGAPEDRAPSPFQEK